MSGGRVRRRYVGACGVLMTASWLVACGDTDDASLCPRYTEYLAALAPVVAADPTAATAAQAVDAIDDVLSSVQQLRVAADTRFAESIDTLEATLDDLLRTLDSVDDEADYQTWAPLVEDSIDDAADAAARVDELIGPECAPAS